MVYTEGARKERQGRRNNSKADGDEEGSENKNSDFAWKLGKGISELLFHTVHLAAPSRSSAFINIGGKFTA
jgi:hypothetical protein